MTKKKQKAIGRFVDDQGRSYSIKITFPKLRWIRDELGIDLGKSKEFIELSNNIIDVVNVLYMLCKEQADKYEVSDVQFGESLVGDSAQAAWDALGEAYLSFCPSHQAKIVRQLMATAQKAELVGAEEAENILNRLVESFRSDSKPQQSQELKSAVTALES